MRILNLILFIGIGILSTSTVGQLSIMEAMLFGLKPTKNEKIEHATKNSIETFDAHRHECVCTSLDVCKTHVNGHKSDERMRSVGRCQDYLDVCCNETIKTFTENYASSYLEKKSNSTFAGLEEKNAKQPFIDQKIDSLTEDPFFDRNNKGFSNLHIEVTNNKPLSDQKKEDKYISYNKIDFKLNVNTNQPFLDQDIEVTTYQPLFKQDIIEITTDQPFIHQEKKNNTKRPFIEYTATIPDQLNTFENPIVTIPTQVNLNNFKCGTWHKNEIGNKSEYGEFSSMVTIFIEEVFKKGEKKLSYHCGGSLIDKNVVLTAAHCVINRHHLTFVIRAGDWDLRSENLFAHQDSNVKKIVTHPKYYSGGLYNDVALIFTEDQFSLQENIKLMCLPASSDTFTDKLCFTSNLSKTMSYNNYAVKRTESKNISIFGEYQVSVFKKLELPIIDRDKCTKSLKTTRLGPKFMLHDSFLCASGEEGKDTCKCEGGSPLICSYGDDPNYLVQVGIMSWGIDCGSTGIPGVYVNVANFVNWIQEEIKENA